MRVLLASHRYAPVAGGTELVVRLLAEGLVRRGHEVTVVTQEEPGLPAQEARQGVQVLRLAIRTVGGIRLPTRYLRTLREIPADLFHVFGNRIWCADFYFPWARLFSWPQLVTGLGFYQWEVAPRFRDRVYFRRYFPWALRAFDRYACSTEHERDLLRSWGVPDRKLELVPAAIGLAEFEHPPEGTAAFRESWALQRPHAAVYVGGYFENKRVDRLIDSIARVRESWALVVIGQDRPGSAMDAASCRRRAEDAGVEFRSLGTIPRLEVLRAIYAADAIVLGSSYEGFGLLPVEAMAASRPFVAFSAGAVPELAATGGGFSVRNEEEFAECLRKLEDSHEREVRGELGRKAAPGYSSEVMVDRYERCYHEMLAPTSGIEPKR